MNKFILLVSILIAVNKCQIDINLSSKQFMNFLNNNCLGNTGTLCSHTVTKQHDKVVVSFQYTYDKTTKEGSVKLLYFVDGKQMDTVHNKFDFKCETYKLFPDEPKYQAFDDASSKMFLCIPKSCKNEIDVPKPPTPNPCAYIAAKVESVLKLITEDKKFDDKEYTNCIVKVIETVEEEIKIKEYCVKDMIGKFTLQQLKDKLESEGYTKELEGKDDNGMTEATYGKDTTTTTEENGALITVK